MLNIARTSDLLLNRFRKLFREFGLTGSQHNVLRILRGEGRPATKAKTVLQKIDGPRTDLYQECLGHLRKTELEQLSSLLEKARRSLRT